MAKNVKSTVKLNMPMVRKLTAAAQVSLVQTAEAIHTNVVQSQVMPRDTGTLQNESTFVYTQDIANGKVEFISSTPYVRRLYPANLVFCAIPLPTFHNKYLILLHSQRYLYHLSLHPQVHQPAFY